MTTDTLETLREKAQEAVAAILGEEAYDYTGSVSQWLSGGVGTEDLSPMVEDPDRVLDITNAALAAVGFDALLEERDELKLNPPETAPRDELILGRFHSRRGPHPTIWDSFREWWVVLTLSQTLHLGMGKTERVFRSAFFPEQALRGWLPMPTIDDQGNVI